MRPRVAASSALFLLILASASASGPSESMSFTPPSADEEEQMSNVLPHRYRCDGCLAVAHQLAAAFARGEGRRGGALPEWQYMEVVDETCAEALGKKRAWECQQA